MDRTALATEWVAELFRFYPEPPKKLLAHLQSDDLTRVSLIITLKSAAAEFFEATIALIKELVREAKERRQAS